MWTLQFVWNKCHILLGQLLSWSYGSWIYNYLCNQCLSPLMMRVRISIWSRCTTLCDKVCQWLATGLWFSPGPLVSSTNKTDRHDITEILLVNTFMFLFVWLFGGFFWERGYTFYILEIICLTPWRYMSYTIELKFVQGSFNQWVIYFSSSHTIRSLNVQQQDSPVNKDNCIQTMDQFLSQFVKLLSQYQLKHS